MGRWGDAGVLPRGAVGLYRVAGTNPESIAAACPCGQGHGGEKAEARPSVAEGLSKHETTACEPGRRVVARWNAHLRFALTTGLRFSAHSNDIINNKRGHFKRVNDGDIFN